MSVIAEDCLWQQLMNHAYDRWQEHEEKVDQDYRNGQIDVKAARSCKWGFDDMLVEACDNDRERTAVVLGKLNQQVDNGGFMQWIDNDYAKHSRDYLGVLMDMGPVSKKVAALCEEAQEIAEDYYSDTDEIAELRMMDQCDALDTQFYALQEEWHKEVYAFLDKS